MSEQRGSGASGHEAAVGTNSPAGEPPASSSSFVGPARRLSAIRDALGDGALRLAYHAAVPVVVDADLLNLLRVNFFLDDSPDVLPFEVEAELLLSPLFREIGEGLYEIDPGLRNLLLSGLHTRYGDERVRRVAALLEQYTDAAAPWRSLPELGLAQQLTALSFLDPAGVERWLDMHEASTARPSSSSTSSADDGPSREWYVAMRRRVAENSDITSSSTMQLYSPPSPQPVGVAFFVSGDGLAVTTLHSIERKSRITARINKASLEASLVYSDRVNDVALIKLDISDAVPLALSNEIVPRVYENVVILSPTAGPRRAKVTSFDPSIVDLDDDNSPARIYIDELIGEGENGSAIVNSSGVAIGMLVPSSHATSPVQYTPAVPSTRIAKDIERYRVLALRANFRAVVLGFDSADIDVRRNTVGEVRDIAASLELEDLLAFCRSSKTAERVGGAIALGVHLKTSQEARRDRRVLSALGELLTDRSSFVRYRAAEVLQPLPTLVPTYDDQLRHLAETDENSWVRRMAAKALQSPLRAPAQSPGPGLPSLRDGEADTAADNSAETVKPDDSSSTGPPQALEPVPGSPDTPAGQRPSGPRPDTAGLPAGQRYLGIERPEDLHHSASGTASLDFDGNDYINRILRPFPEDGELPPPAERYALDQRHLDMADGDLIGWIDQVVGLWRRQSGGVPRIAEVSERFLAADEELRGTIPYQDPQWWRDQIGAETTRGSGDDASDWETEPADPPPASGPPVSAVTDGAGSSPPPTAAPQPGKAPPPTEVTADQVDDRVVVRWPAPPNAPDIRFTVERMARPGVEPRRWTTSGNTIEDNEPPAGQPLLYRIRIHLADSDVQPPRMQTAAVFTPPVAGLVASQVSDGGVMGRWRTRANLHETQVWRTPAGSSADPADAALVPSRLDGFHDRHPPPGLHTYSVVPIYRDPETGMTYRGEYRSIDVPVVDRPPPPRLERDHARQEGISAVALRWDPLPPGVSLLLRQAATDPAGAAGDSLTLEEARNVGKRVADGQALGGTTAEVALPAGDWIIIPFAVAGNLAVRGHAVTVDVVPAVTLPEAIRNGPDVHVNWDWPEGLTMARVVCRAGGVDRPREVTLHEFRRHGRVTFQVRDAAEVQIYGLVRRGAELLVSAPATARAPAQTPTLTYRVYRVRPWQVSRTRPYRVDGPRRSSATRRVVLTVDLPCTGLTVELFANTPDGDRDSEVALTEIKNLELGPGRSHEMMLTLPDLSAMDRPRYMYGRAETMSGPVVVNDVHSEGREL